MIGAYPQLRAQPARARGQPRPRLLSRGGGRSALRRADLHRQFRQARRSAPATLSRCDRGRHALPAEPPRRELSAVHRRPPGAGRRAEPARLAGHPAALRAPPGGDGHRPLRALRRLPRAAGPDQVAAAGRGLRGRAAALGPSHGAESSPTRSALSLAHHPFAWAGIGASTGEACCGRGRVWTATRRGRGRRLMPVPPERWMRLTQRL